MADMNHDFTEAESAPRGATGFRRPHRGTLRRIDAGTGARAAGECRRGLCGFAHWRDAIRLVDRCLVDLDLSSNAARLLQRLAELVPAGDWSGDGALMVWPTNGWLAAELGIGTRSVQRLIRDLEDRQLLSRTLGRGARRSNRRLPDGTVAEQSGIDLAPLPASARRIADSLDTPRHIEATRIHAAVAEVQGLAARVVEAAEALEQAAGDDPGIVLPAGLDELRHRAGQLRRMARGAGRSAHPRKLEELTVIREQLAGMAGDLAAALVVLDRDLQAAFGPGPEVGPAVGPEAGPEAGEASSQGSRESPRGDSRVVQNNENPTSSCSVVARQGAGLAPRPELPGRLPGLAPPPPEDLEAGIRSVSPAYARRFRVSHLMEACPALAEAAAAWDLGPEAWDDLERNTEMLKILCVHAAGVAGFAGDRWAAEARRWGFALVVLTTAAALGKPEHQVRRNPAALLNWYLTDGLALGSVDVLATLNANRRHWTSGAGTSQASAGRPGSSPNHDRDDVPRGRQTGHGS